MKVNFYTTVKAKQKLPKSRVGFLLANVKVLPPNTDLDNLITSTINTAVEQTKELKESQIQIVEETRNAYKVCGKEPSRYRPSSEALLRRIRTGKGLYRINNIVDIINVLSVSSHYSIGGFDFNKIQGDIHLDIGDNNPYHAIGRGQLNIEFMPGLRDDLGFFGTPTSDSERTMVTSEIQKLLLVYYDFYGNQQLEESLIQAKKLIEMYCSGTNVVTGIQ